MSPPDITSAERMDPSVVRAEAAWARALQVMGASATPSQAVLAMQLDARQSGFTGVGFEGTVGFAGTVGAPATPVGSAPPTSLDATPLSASPAVPPLGSAGPSPLRADAAGSLGSGEKGGGFHPLHPSPGRKGGGVSTCSSLGYKHDAFGVKTRDGSTFHTSQKLQGESARDE